MRRRRALGFWLWLLTALPLGAGMLGWRPGVAVAIAVTAAQVLHQAARTRSLRAPPVQVRAAYLGLLLIGLLPPPRVLHALLLAGTLSLLVFDYCPLARLLSLLPGNRRAPLTWALLRTTFLSPPVPDVFRAVARTRALDDR
jgi:hypothetical protein